MAQMCPSTEEDILNCTASHFGVSVKTIRPYFLDAMSRGGFTRGDAGGVAIISFDADEAVQENSWESDHGLDPHGKVVSEEYPEDLVDLAMA